MWLDPTTWQSALIAALVALFIALLGVVATRAWRRRDDVLKEREALATTLLHRLDAWAPSPPPPGPNGTFYPDDGWFGDRWVYLAPPDAWEDPSIRDLLTSGVTEDELEDTELVFPTFTGYATSDWPGSTEATWLAAGAIKQPDIDIPGVLQIREPWLTRRFIHWYLTMEAKYLRLAGAAVVKPDGSVQTFQSSPWERRRGAEHWKQTARRGVVLWARGSVRRGRMWAAAALFRPWGVWAALIVVSPIVIAVGIIASPVIIWETVRHGRTTRRLRVRRADSARADGSESG